MIRKANIFAMAVLMVAAYCSPGYGQVAPPAILEVDVENWVHYVEDSSDLSKFATDPNVTTPAPSRNFSFRLGIADIVAVNGQAAKGTLILNIRNVNLTTAPNPGQAIADIVRAGVLGARGQLGWLSGGARLASMTEDPANRRRNGGTRTKFVLQVIPMSVPQIVTTPNGPAVAHSGDFSLVSASKPAAAGEILSVFVTGLGPTNPGVDPGKPFPASPLAAVNSPVDVTVNGKSVEVTAAAGFPGAVDGYQVNFRVPSDAAKGVATIQVSAAWIAGTPVSIAVQ